MARKTTFRVGRSGWGRSNRLGAVEVISPQLHRALWVQLLLALWRWSIEILLLIGLLICWFRLASVMPNYATAMVMAFPIVTVCNFRWGRRLVAGWVCVLFVRHRIRTALVQLGSRNRSGKVPWLIWWHPTPVGERVWLVLVAGMSATQIEEAADALAAACWARQVRVDKSRRWTNWVRVDVIRHDPLESATPIRSRLFKRNDVPIVGAAPITATSGPTNYEAASLFRFDGHPAADNPTPKPPRGGSGRDDGPDDDGGLSDYV